MPLYSRMIHDYFDGGLDRHQEEQLFDALGRDEELRAEFNAELQLQNAISRDAMSIHTPGVALKEVYRQIGFGAGAGSSTTAGAGGIAGWIARYLAPLRMSNAKVAAYLAGGVVPILLATLLFFSQDEAERDAALPADPGQSELATMLPGPVEGTAAVPGTSASRFNSLAFSAATGSASQELPAADPSTAALMPDDSPVRDSRPTPLEQSLPTPDRQAVLAQRSVIHEVASTAMLAAEDRRHNGAAAPSSGLAALDRLAEFSLIDLAAEHNFSVYARGLSSDPGGSNQSFSLLSAMAIGFALPVNERLLLSVEVGNESFDQSTSIPDPSNPGENLVIPSTAEMFWAGIAGRYRLPLTVASEDLSFFGQPGAALAYSNTFEGALAKLGVGLEYRLESSFTVFAGWEWTYLMSLGASTNSTAGKQGLTYGVSFKF